MIAVAGDTVQVSPVARVSTDSIEQGESFENQVITYERLIKSNPEYEFAGVYADQGISGTSEKSTGISTNDGGLREWEDRPYHYKIYFQICKKHNDSA